MNLAGLEHRAALWRRHYRLRRILFAAGAAALAAACGVRFSPAAAAVAGVAVAAGVWLFLRRREPKITAAAIAVHLNRSCPTLEESATLWLRAPTTFSLVERLQHQRLELAWAALADRATLGCPVRATLRPATGVAMLGLVALLLAGGWPRAALVAPTQSPPVPSVATIKEPVPVSLRTATVVVEPPGYLARPLRRLEGLDGEVVEGAAITWEMTFAGDIAAVTIESTGRNEQITAESVGGGFFRARSSMSDTRLYQLAVTGGDGRRVLWPQVHTLKIIRDQPPKLAWQHPAVSRTIVDPAGELAVPVRLAVTDDHGLADVHLVITVAKGSGEGVKFREQNLPLDRSPDGASYGRVLDLNRLGLEPGDELYFHADAIDNRTPRPNQARSETRFLVLRGPATERADPGVALAGLKVVPQYFRSQRQLIIDTERLLAEQPTLTTEKFRERSEEIGIDQKLLRLRYGQFLGEEFEAELDGAPKEAQAMGFAARLQGRSPGTDARAAGVERVIEAQHNHEAVPNRERPATIEEIRAPFVHAHDNAEVATVFDEKVKASLRAVLAAMWEAEGLLRTGRAAEALPPENRALELLKELQQADRVYVKRVGFEPAPLKIDERRLRGELDAIPKQARTPLAAVARSAEILALQAALAALGRDGLAGLPAETAAVVEGRLTAAALEKPESFVPALEIWRRRSGGTNASDHGKLQQALWALLPAPEESPRRPAEAAPALAGKYFEALRTDGPTPR